ncbi:Basic pathogenesis-related protein 1 [Theobroma cacao]|uniref:Pathogenesis-related protein 1 n=1 Tax=Theobroma cacao TaxID=3641 RepID=A0A061DWT3_THECC|nr:Basic pathogenesis-related protein 1 [Theobroma cacao]
MFLVNLRLHVYAFCFPFEEDLRLLVVLNVLFPWGIKTPKSVTLIDFVSAVWNSDRWAPYGASQALGWVQWQSGSESKIEKDTPEDFLDAHNTARAAVGVGPMTWNDTVAAYAQDYANERIGDYNLEHSTGPYGENLAISSGDLSGTQAVRLWVDEKVYYDYDTNTRATDRVCGHYTQVVWRNSVRLGCAKVRCSNGGTFIGCNYDPPGNFGGEKPY